MVNQRTLTHAHQEALHSSLFVSYLYNYFKVSTDFGFPFREKTIKPCSPGLSGESVRIISLQMPLTMMLDGEVRTRVSESLAESQLRAAPVTPKPSSSFSLYKSHKRLNRSFQLIDIDRSSQVLSINQTSNQPVICSLHKIGCVTTSAKKNNQSPKSRALIQSQP